MFRDHETIRITPNQGQELPKPAEKTSVVFGTVDELVETGCFIFTEPQGFNNLYMLADTKNHILFTNCLTNDQGQVCTSNFTEKYTNFTVGEGGEIVLGTALWVHPMKGISVPWHLKP
jgi:hypothetical protein